MAKVTQTYNPSHNGGNNLPTPILGLGENYFLTNNRIQDFNTFITTNYSSSNYKIGGSVNQDGTAWANDALKISISYEPNDFTTWLENKPMIFLEVLDQTSKKNKNGRYSKPQWGHPVNKDGQLNRTRSNYGGGDVSTLTTEWDFTPTKPFTEEQIQIQPQGFYYDVSIALPIRWVEFVTTTRYSLKWQTTGRLVPTGNGNSTINTFVQPIRFRFGYIDPKDGRSVILGKPSEQLFVSPKWGHFNPDDDTYVYDWQIRFNR